MTDRKHEPAFKLDINFNEALQRFVASDPRELPPKHEKTPRGRKPSDTDNASPDRQARREKAQPRS